MGKPQSAAKLQQLGGALQGDPDRQLICKAFVEAVDDFCNTRSLGANRSFNDYFFKSLANQGPRGAQIAGAIQREVPFILERTAQGVQAVGQASQVASGAATATTNAAQGQQIAQAIMTDMLAVPGNSPWLTGAGAVTGVGNAMLGAGHAAWAVAGAAAFGMRTITTAKGVFSFINNPTIYPRFADGVYNNRVFEIKGPQDRLSGRQAADARRVGNGQDPYVVGCKSCSVNCSGGCPKTIKQGPLP